MSRIFFIFIFLFSLSAQARLLVDISMVYKNGIDKNLVLESELHSVEEIWGKRRIQLVMKNGTKLTLMAGFWERPQAVLEHTGPSSLVFFEGNLTQPNGKLAKRLKKTEDQVELGNPYVFSFTDQTQLIEVSVKPYLK